MPEHVTRFPLTWPTGWTRTPPGARGQAKFSKQKTNYRQRSDGSPYTTTSKDALTVFDATQRLLAELERLRAREVIVSTNLKLRQDGLPRGDQARPSDPGAAVYFKLRTRDRCLACDRYLTVEGNLAAMAAHIEALRAIERHGVGTMEQAFAGYAALPPTAVDWWLVLGVSQTATRDQIESKFRELALEHHPDRGGSHETMARLTAARDAARRAFGGV